MYAFNFFYLAAINLGVAYENLTNSSVFFCLTNNIIVKIILKSF